MCFVMVQELKQNALCIPKCPHKRRTYPPFHLDHVPCTSHFHQSLNKQLQVIFMMSPLPRCISALFLLLEINRQCTPQKNVSFSPAITWKIEVHLSFVVIDIYKECNTHSCMTQIKQPTYECYCMFHAVDKLRTSITHYECIVFQAVNIGILTFNVSANAWYCEAEKVKWYGQAIRQDNLGSRDGQYAGAWTYLWTRPPILNQDLDCTRLQTQWKKKK